MRAHHHGTTTHDWAPFVDLVTRLRAGGIPVTAMAPVLRITDRRVSPRKPCDARSPPHPLLPELQLAGSDHLAAGSDSDSGAPLSG